MTHRTVDMSYVEKDPHLHVKIRHDQQDALVELLPWGAKTKVIEVLLDQLIAALRGPHGQYVLGAMMKNHLDLTDKFKPKEEANKNANVDV